MENINVEGKFEGPCVACKVFGDEPKYHVELEFHVGTEDGVKIAVGKFYVSLKAGGENTTATAQLKNAGMVFSKPIYTDSVFDTNAFWDAVEAFKIDPSKSHKVTVKLDTYKDETNYRVAFIEGPHRGISGGAKQASRPAPSNSIPF